MRKYTHSFKISSSNGNVFHVFKDHIYFQHIRMCQGTIIDEINLKGYHVSDFIYEYPLYFIEYGKFPFLHQDKTRCMEPKFTYTRNIGFQEKRISVALMDSQEIPNEVRNVLIDDKEMKKDLLIDNKSVSIDDKEIKNISIDNQEIRRGIENYRSDFMNYKKVYFQFRNIKVIEPKDWTNIDYKREILLNDECFYECIIPEGFLIISSQYHFILDMCNSIGIDTMNNKGYIYDSGVKEYNISMFTAVLRLFTGNFSNLENLFTTLALKNQDYFWRYLPKEKDLICTLYRQTDLKNQLKSFIGDFYGSTASGISKIIIYFPEMEDYFVNIALRSKKDYMIEEYIKYLQKRKISTKNVAKILIQYNCFYLYSICQSKNEVRNVKFSSRNEFLDNEFQNHQSNIIDEWRELIDLERLYTKILRIKDKKRSKMVK